jgi:predicted amidohydrolase YtcJ
VSNEYLCVYSALKAITLGAAYTLKLDGEIGSIEAGRWADFAIFDEDPLTGKPADQENIRIAGTIIAGGAFDA